MIIIKSKELEQLIKKHVKDKHGIKIDDSYHIEIDGSGDVKIGKVIMVGPCVTMDTVVAKGLKALNKIRSTKT